MSYQVLARKWRPGTFGEMVGQQHVLRALSNALDRDRLHHAYLFTGTRGVGKTTVARILAKCLNCEQGVSAVPCGTCGACLEVAEGRSVDLIEVDAASRTKVDDTRELLDNVQYAPTRSRFKIYLIDEVHMLSAHSFNALLKTLEEPPPHVKFLLATTDPQKLPATVLSRCLQFHLKNMTPEGIAGHLASVLQAEAVDYDEPALQLIGRAASGSMRDALSLTDQAIAYGGGQLREPEVRSMLGVADRSAVLRLLLALAVDDGPGLLDTVSQMAESAGDFGGSLDELITFLHRLAVLQIVPGAAGEADAATEELASLAQRLSGEDVQLFYQMAVSGRTELASAPDARAAFEMVLLRMLAFRPLTAGQEPAPAAPSSAAGEVGGEVKKPEAPPRGAEKEAEHTETGHADTELDWMRLLPSLELTGSTLMTARNCEWRSHSAQRVELVLDPQQANLFNARQAERIEKALRRALNQPALTVSVAVGELRGETPAAREARLLAERRAAAIERMRRDSRVSALMSRFAATLDENGIELGLHAAPGDADANDPEMEHS
jgi:DNA polymerase-3 subunit gamma/tau